MAVSGSRAGRHRATIGEGQPPAALAVPGAAQSRLPGSGEEAFVNIQHRAYDDSIDRGHRGALVKISGFKVRSHDSDHDDHDRDDDWR